MLHVEIPRCPNGQVQVELLGYFVLRPRRPPQFGHLLERDARRAGRVTDDQPVLTSLIGLISRWGFVARALHEAEQLPVELREAAGVRGAVLPTTGCTSAR